jgi:hypothetical protein
MSLDLTKLANKLDEALIKETTETLTKFLNDKRMTNNKQQTAVDSIIEFCQELLGNHYSISHDGVCSAVIEFCQQQAKEMEKERMIEFAQSYAVIHCMGDITKNAEQYYYETYGGNK